MAADVGTDRTLILTVLVELHPDDDPSLVADAVAHAAKEDAGQHLIKVIDRGISNASLANTFTEKIQDEPDNHGFVGEDGERLPE